MHASLRMRKYRKTPKDDLCVIFSYPLELRSKTPVQNDCLHRWDLQDVSEYVACFAHVAEIAVGFDQGPSKAL